MANSLVSVIMPCYNAAPFLKDAIESVLKQSHSEIELIIVNDGSTDESDKIIKSFSDPRIVYIEQQNLGQCVASNIGYYNSSGSFIKFVDADDIMNREHIAEQLKKLNSNEEAISFCSWARFYESNIQTSCFREQPYWKDMNPMEWIKSNMSCKYDMMPAWFWLIPRKVIEKAGGWNEALSLNNDFEFSVRLLMHASYVYFVPHAKMFYRSGNQKSLSSNLSEEAYRSAILSAKIGCSLLLQKEDTNETRLLCANKYCFLLYQIYPHYPTLVKELERQIKCLGGANRLLDESLFMHQLQKIFGWKAAKKLKQFMYRYGYQKYILPYKMQRNKNKHQSLI